MKKNFRSFNTTIFFGKKPLFFIFFLFIFPLTVYPLSSTPPSDDGQYLVASIPEQVAAGSGTPSDENKVITGDTGSYPADDDESSILTDYVKKDLSPQLILVALGVAFFLGAVHALSPGHGKAMVAAYLVGSRGTVKDAVVLGGIVTFTHVISVIILGVVALALQGYFVQEKLHGWIGFVSGVLIFIIGYWMLARRALESSHRRHHTHHDHSHSHDHDHGHSHAPAPEGDVTLGSLFTLGIAGGMVPCPSALVVLLVSISVHKILFGLLLIISFSLGLAAIQRPERPP